MEGSKEGRIDVVVFCSQVRDPYMGNSIPLSVYIYIEKGEVVFVEVENPERMKITAKKSRAYSINAKAFHRATTGL